MPRDVALTGSLISVDFFAFLVYCAIGLKIGINSVSFASYFNDTFWCYKINYFSHNVVILLE